MTNISRSTAQVKAAAGKSHARSVAVRDLIGTLDAAVAPALRGDVPEYGVISALWTDARTGLKDTSAQLERTHAQAQAYAAVCEIIERTHWSTIGKGKDLLDLALLYGGTKASARLKTANRRANAAKGKLKRANNRLNAQPNKKDPASKEAREKNRNRIRDEKLPKAKAEADEAAKAAGKFDRAAKAAKYGGRGFTVFSTVAEGYDQFNEDSEKHKNLNTTTKVARAGVVSGSSLVAGVAAGAAVGSIIPGPGTAAGAVAGAAVVGVAAAAGSIAGSKAAKKFIDSDVGKSVGHGAEKVGSSAKKGAKKVGHFITHPPTPW